MAEMTSLVVSISILQKEQAATFAQQNNVSLSSVVRRALAEATGYDLEEEIGSKIERRGRPRKYASDEDRKEAARERTRVRDELTRRLLEDHQQQIRRRDAEKLEASLRKRGVL